MKALVLDNLAFPVLPLDSVLLGVFGVSALVMSIGAVPLFMQLFPQLQASREAADTAVQEPRA